MRAIVVRGTWELGVEELQTPSPQAGEVLIEVAGCGICHSNLHQIRGDLPISGAFVPGHETSGTIVAVGPGVDAARIGERVVAPFIMPCGECEQCRGGRDDLCEWFWRLNRGAGALYDGTTRLYEADGTPVRMDAMSGLAEFAVIPAEAAFVLPESVDLVDASVLGCAVFTAYGAVKRVGAVARDTPVVIVGVGGVGLQMVRIAHVLGANPVVAVDVAADKLRAAEHAGATASVCTTQTADWQQDVRELTDGGAVTAIEAIGKPQTVEGAIAVTRPGGRTVLVGVARGGDHAALDINAIVRGGQQICGSYGARPLADMPAIIELAASGALDFTAGVSEHVSLAEVPDAFRRLDHGAVVGRIVMDNLTN